MTRARHAASEQEPVDWIIAAAMESPGGRSAFITPSERIMRDCFLPRFQNAFPSCAVNHSRKTVEFRNGHVVCLLAVNSTAQLSRLFGMQFHRVAIVCSRLYDDSVYSELVATARTRLREFDSLDGVSTW